MPPEFTFDSLTRVIGIASGATLIAGNYSFGVTADDSNGGTDTAIVTITVASSAKVAVVWAADGNESTLQDGRFTVTQTVTTSVDTVVNYTVNFGFPSITQATQGEDYTTLYSGDSGQITIPAGQLSVDVTIDVLDDSIVDADPEQVRIRLTSIESAAAGVSINALSDEASLLITGDNDSSLVSIAATQHGVDPDRA